MPLVFGLGAPLAAMVGTSIGAGRRDRALRVAWTGAAIAGVLTEAIGLAAAALPQAWLSLFGSDATMIEIGARYLRIVGPFYGFFGTGLALYFASQGAGRLGWPLVGATAARRRSRRSAAGSPCGSGGGIGGVFLALGVALAVFGIVNAAAVGSGVWFRGTESDTPVPRRRATGSVVTRGWHEHRHRRAHRRPHAALPRRFRRRPGLSRLRHACEVDTDAIKALRARVRSAAVPP